MPEFEITLPHKVILSGLYDFGKCIPEIEGEVVGFDKDIGITIIEKHTGKNKYVVCLNGPLSPLCRNRDFSKQKKDYDFAFDYIYENIKNGTHIYIPYLLSQMNSQAKSDSDISPERCAFNQ